jgi:HK97 family phage major capsid protein
MMPTVNTTEMISAREAVFRRELRNPKPRHVDLGARTVELAFSSDAPVPIGDVNEILDHGLDSVRLGRLNSGAAVLVGHDHSDQVGVVERAWTDTRESGEGVGRALVRFGRSARASDILNDVVDGIRQLVSVGYLVHAWDQTPDGDVRATDWEPIEISFVPVPADAGVGVGREHGASRQQRSGSMVDNRDERDTEREDEYIDIGGGDAAGDGEAPAEDGGAGQGARDELDAQIRTLSRRFDRPDVADNAIALGCSYAQARDMLRAAVISTPPVPVPSARTVVRVEGGRPRYRRLHAFKDQGEEIAYRMGQWTRAHLFGDDRAIRWCNDHHVRVMQGGILSKGGAVVPDEMSQAIIDLREMYGVMRQLLRVVPMNSDTLTVPRRTGGVTAYFVGENTQITESDKSWDDVQLTAKKLAALTRMSTDYAEDAVIDVAEDLSNEMAWAFAQKEDDCAINGDGTSTYGGIYGFRPKIIDGNHAAGAVDAASAIDTFAEVTQADLDSALAALPAYALPGTKWLISSPGKALVFDSLAAAAGGNTMTDLAGKPGAAYLGYPITVSQAMPTSTGDLSNLVMLLAGNFELAATLGDRRGFTVRVLVERYADYDQIGVVGTERFDVVVHDLGDGTTAGPVVALVGE